MTMMTTIIVAMVAVLCGVAFGALSSIHLRLDAQRKPAEMITRVERLQVRRTSLRSKV